jgi:subtilisin family serine protease
MGRLDASLIGADGAQTVIIRLSAESGAEAFAKGKATWNAKKIARAQQKAFLKRVGKIDSGAQVIGQVQMVLNAVFVEVDANALPVLAMDPDVVRVAPVGHYEMDLSETVPYIGASAVQAEGFDGSGIKVAVLDSGIDYYHAAFGGSGDPADYAADDPTIIEPGTFPTAKVVGGFDFVGSDWPFGPVAPDPDPLDDGPYAFHGTHVGHIIGGYNGVAPGVDLYAVKVCSSQSGSCNGIAMINGLEFAVDPNGDGKVKDRVDIVNMSIGSKYGQAFDDDISTAVDNATALGVLTVCSAGNSSDKPYVTGTPGSAPTALSVAQTHVPSAVQPLMRVTAPGTIAGLYLAVHQSWSAPLTVPIEAPLQYGDGGGGNLLGCSLGSDPNSTEPTDAPFPAGSLTGKIVLVDRGTCNFSIKIFNIQRGGGVAGIIGLVAPGNPFDGALGAGGPFTIPGYMISQVDSDDLKGELPATVVRFDPADTVPLAMSMVDTSSRGPQHEYTTLIKPEIGAPGASISAVAGSGTGENPFGGTSGASPMVAGSAALLLEGFGGTKTTGNGKPPGNAFGHGLSPVEVKALLMNNGETDIVNDALMSGDLAPITRVGGGEVRVDRALSALAAAWDDEVPQGALSFGFVDVADDVVSLTKTVRVRNYSKEWRTYDIIPTFRFEDDALNGAVTVSAPESVTINPGIGSDAFFDVTLTIDGALLEGNFMSSGSMGADPSGLTINEFDGYLVLDDGEHPIHLAWHVLPRKAAEVVPDTTTVTIGAFPDVIGLNNLGVGDAQNDAYSLIAVSPDQPEGDPGAESPTPDIRAVGISTFPVPAGFCSGEDSFLWAFAVNTWERQEHLVPVIHNVYVDTNQDGDFDYAVFNFDLSLSGSISDGRQVTWVEDLVGGGASAFFFAEHSMNTGNTVLYICAEQIGLTGTDMLATNVDMFVYTQDWYYGGPGDLVEGLTVTPLGERFYGLPNDVPANTYDAAGLSVYDFGPFPGNSPELGLMLFTNGDRGGGARGGATQDTEALLLIAE